jgi:DNA-binding transcriptional LysR family regulator
MSSPISRDDLGDLQCFLIVAQERSFTRAAAIIGVSRSALSHSMRRLEDRLQVRLLSRTTRSVGLTEAGEQLLASVRPHFQGIESQLESLSALRERPAGTVRITADEHARRRILWPVLRRIMPDYPDIRVEIVTDYALTDIVSERFDAGVRPGGIIANDMVAMPIGPEMRMMVVGTPKYLADRPTPRTPQDLTGHRCINLRLPTYGGVYAWEFEKEGREFSVRVEGQFVFNSIEPILEAALDGFGLAYLPDAQVLPFVERGELVSLLSDWLAPFAGYHLYYPSRRQVTPAFRVLVEALRYRGPQVHPANT